MGKMSGAWWLLGSMSREGATAVTRRRQPAGPLQLLQMTLVSARGTGPPSSGQGVDAGCEQEHDAGDDVVDVGLQTEQAEAVVDHRDDEAAEDGVPGLAFSAEQRCSTDDGGSHRVEQHIS